LLLTSDTVLELQHDAGKIAAHVNQNFTHT
jgi:hypothetical protein